jgi:hypothetical protein
VIGCVLSWGDGGRHWLGRPPSLRERHQCC